MDTIAAIATAAGASAIGIVRISGERTRAVCAGLFTPKNGKAVADLPARTMTYGTIRDADGAVLDSALLVLFDAGSSYTGEQSAELHCHGSPIVLRAVLERCFACGARQATAGEYTKRAFLNGKMDLTEAEAVIDLIDAESTAAARNAAAQLGGALRTLTDRVYDTLLDISSRFYAVVDYPDEDIEDLTRTQTDTALADAEQTLCDLFATAERGKVLKSGVRTVLLGAPNAGKSSLLNRLVGFDRAIVTAVAGTTRDTVEEKAIVGGVTLLLTDTAGIHESQDTVEQLGIERSRAAAAQADLLLALVDASRPPDGEDAQVLSLAAQSGKPWIFLRSKCDLAEKIAPVPVPGGSSAPCAVIDCSAVSGAGLDALAEAVAALFPAGTAPVGTILTNARQVDAVGRALSAVRAARKALGDGMTPDVILLEVETATAALGELTGKTARDDMVSRIFERFCVGK